MKVDAALLAVLPSTDSTHYYVAGRSHLVSGRAVAVTSIVDGEGNSVAPAGVGARVVTAGTTWDVTLTEGASDGRRALIVEVGGGGAEDIAKGGAVGVGAASEGGWVPIGIIYPRRKMEEGAVDSIIANVVRLTFAHDYVVGDVKVITSPQPIIARLTSPSIADLSSNSALSAVSSVDGQIAQVADGSTLSLRFGVRDSSSSLQRQAFLFLRGKRTSAVASSRARARRPDVARLAFFVKAPHPNPFQKATSLDFSVSSAGLVGVTVYDLLGRRIRRLYYGHAEAGGYHLEWDRRDDKGDKVRAGVYLLRLILNSEKLDRRLVVVD